MNDQTSQSGDTNLKSSPQEMSGLAKIRKLVLFGFLALMVLAIVYDYMVARPAVAAAYDQIATESQRKNGTAGEYFSNEDVQSLLGKSPSKKFTDGSEFIEVYDYRAGIPGRPHQLFTVFKSKGDRKLFHRHAKFVYEKASDVAPFAELTIVEMSEEDKAVFEELTKEEQRELADLELRDPAAVFESFDLNNDGELDANEIMEEHVEDAEKLDTDGDKTLSLDEFKRYYEKEGEVQDAANSKTEETESDPTE